jgi:hypothetical protein
MEGLVNKDYLLALKANYELNEISLSDLFLDACEDIYLVRCSVVSPIVQCNRRAINLAFPFVALSLDLVEFCERNV